MPMSTRAACRCGNDRFDQHSICSADLVSFGSCVWMKIAWVTPFNQRSAIGRVSAAVTRLLWARGHQVTIIRSELRAADPSPQLPTPLRVLKWHDLLPSDVGMANDAIVVNLGDHYGFHAGCLQFLDTVPCLGIFHDFFLYYFFYEWVRDQAKAIRSSYTKD